MSHYKRCLSLHLAAIASSQVDDVRPVLNNYKSQGDGKNILETFKERQAQLQAAEEERQREAMARRSSHVGGAVQTFRLGFGHRQEPSVPVGSSTVPESGPSEKSDSESSEPDQSWVEWIGTWIGWK